MGITTFAPFIGAHVEQIFRNTNIFRKGSLSTPFKRGAPAWHAQQSLCSFVKTTRVCTHGIVVSAVITTATRIIRIKPLN
jgi:hypothetical protein